MIHRDDQKLQVQQATDIVRLIGEDISLRPRGREFLGLCPFHDDKKPSMHVSPIKQIYKCFSCGAGGDVFSFVMMYHKMTFPEALAHLAQRAGVTLKTGTEAGSGTGSSTKQQIADANETAQRFFCQALADPNCGREAQEYLQKRGVSREMIDAFHIGYAPDQWDALVGHMRQQRVAAQGFDLAGLTVAKKDGQGVYDRFRHRLMFPIMDGLGRVIAFGARQLRSEDQPKYLNSPETPLFSKSMTLYGLHLAKKPIIDSHVAVVVEGYTDVIACHQAGVRNVVATLGTAFTRGHASALGRLCDRVVLVFDADQAGQKAADRAVDVFFGGSIDVQVAVLPDGIDPAEFLEQPEGRQRFEELVKQAVDALQYKLSRMSKEIKATDTLTGRERVGQRYLRELVELGGLRQGELRSAMVVDRVAQLLGVNQRVIESQLRKLSMPRKTAHINTPLTPSEPSSDSDIEKNDATGVVWANSEPRIRALKLAQRHVIGCLLRRPDLFHWRLSDGMTLDEALTVAEMITPQAKALYSRIHDRLSDSTALKLTDLLADLAHEGQQELANLATDSEAQIEACCGDDSERMETLIQEAADSILLHHKEQSYEQDRRDLLESVSSGSTSVADSELFRLAEHRRDHPSSVRIARISGQ